MRRKMTNLQLLMTMNYHLMMKSLMANLMSLVQTTSSFSKIIDVKLICAFKDDGEEDFGEEDEMEDDLPPDDEEGDFEEDEEDPGDGTPILSFFI